MVVTMVARKDNKMVLGKAKRLAVRRVAAMVVE
jgi:hypothetical protein